MPTSPNQSFSTLRPDLRDTLMEFDLAADRMGFVGLRIAPSLEVQKPFGEYPVIPLKEMLKSRDTRRASDGSYAHGEGRGSKDSYSTEEHGLAERVDDREAEMYADWWDAEVLATERCVDAVLRNHNQRVIDAALGISNTTTGSDWTDQANATPIDDVRGAKVTVRNRTGIVPNAMCIDWELFENLKDVSEIVDRIKYSGLQDPNRSEITTTALARAFDLDELIVSGSVKNTANENKSASVGSMWTTSKALVFRKERTRNMRRPQFMRTFHWGADGSQIGGVIESYRDESRRSDMVRSRMETDEKKVYEECAQVLDTLTG